jgi:hypothetical protein
MILELEVDQGEQGGKVYSGEYDILAMATALGVMTTSEARHDLWPENLVPKGGIGVTVIPESCEESLAIAKMVNYSHAALTAQGVETPVNYLELRNRLVNGPLFTEKESRYFIFANTDETLFFLSVMRQVDLHYRPKWQIWLVTDDKIEVPDGVKVKVFDEEHFITHYFHRVTKQNIPALTHTKVGSPEYKLLDAIRTRLGKGMGLIKTTRVRMSDEDKLARYISHISDEDRALAPAAFEDLKNGVITTKQYTTSLWGMKRSQRTSARASVKVARKVVVGTKATVTKVLSPGVQSRIDKIKQTIEKRRTGDAD